MVNPTDIAGNAEEEEKEEGEWWTPWDIAGNAEEEGEPQKYSWEQRRRRWMVGPTDIAGNKEEEEWWAPQI